MGGVAHNVHNVYTCTPHTTPHTTYHTTYHIPGAGEGRADRAEALQAIVDAVTACKYESTDPASDEVVLFKILQVLLACAKHPMSPSLSDEHIKTIFEACYRIGQLQSDGGKALLGMCWWACVGGHAVAV